MHRFIPICLAALLAVAVLGVTSATAVAEDSSTDPQASSASVVRVTHQKPARHAVVRRSFRPWARPSKRQVRQIIRIEARRWKIDGGRLARRIACESGFSWSAFSGTYYGLLQFAPSTFYRGLRSVRDRDVRLVKSAIRKVRSARVVHYSDGRTDRKPGPRRRQRVFYVYRGKLPRNPGVTHAWTQVRIGAQAIRGISAVRSSEWGCPA